MIVACSSRGQRVKSDKGVGARLEAVSGMWAYVDDMNKAECIKRMRWIGSKLLGLDCGVDNKYLWSLHSTKLSGLAWALYSMRSSGLCLHQLNYGELWDLTVMLFCYLTLIWLRYRPRVSTLASVVFCLCMHGSTFSSAIVSQPGHVQLLFCFWGPLMYSRYTACRAKIYI